MPRLLLVLALLAPLARAEVTLHTLFSPHAILQRDKPLPIWGWADPGETITVTLGNETATTKAADDRRWRITLPPQPLSKTPLTLTVKGANTLTVPDILLGDLWLCSGQSNMTMTLGGYSKDPDTAKDLASANSPLIRQFGVEKTFAATPQENVKAEWLAFDKKNAPRFSAAAFYFARKVHAETGVPIGILRSAAGGTIIECWLSQETFLTAPALEPIAKTMRVSLATWETEKAAALKAGKTPDSPDFPPFPFGEKVRKPRAVTLHNGMIAPLIPCALRGVIWYQGESNALDLAGAKSYIEKQRLLIADWRRMFEDPSLPFLYVQLPNYRPSTDLPGANEFWSYLRESQRQCLAIPNTGMAITIDIGEAEDIHPRNKFDAGQRLALWALAKVYNKTDLPFSGPLFRNAKVEGDKIRISFDHAAPGLMIAEKTGRSPAVELKDAQLKRFAIAGADRKWVWADAIIDGETVLVSSPQVPAPVAVRYAFSSNPTGVNLYNRAGLPAAPFRTDDW